MTATNLAGADGAAGDGSDGSGPAQPGDDSAPAGGGGTISFGDGPPITIKSAGAVQMRHLLKREIVAAYNDLLGPTPSVDWKVVADDSSASSYDNDIDKQSLNAADLRGYIATASQAANDVVTATTAKTFFGCKGNVDKTCMTSFVKAFGLRVFRRPLLADESAALLAVWSSESDPVAGGRLVVWALLSSPSFLFQPEVGVTATEKPGYVRLTGYERATRLALLLTGTVPSSDLLAQAKAGKLDTADGVGTAAQALLATPAAKRNLRWFFVNWFNANASVGSLVSAEKLPNDTKQLRADMNEESLRLFDDFAAPGQRVLGMLTADYTYVTPALAALYGTGKVSQNWSRVSLDGVKRLGILTQPNMLVSASGSGPASILRGKWVRSRLLCQIVGSPPNNIANLMLGEASGGATGKTERQLLAAHLKDPTCAGCHNLMDPIGFGFEQYDRVGNLRSTGADGSALTGVGEVKGENSYTFAGPVDLARKLAADKQVQACAGEKLATYLLGHVPTDEDADTASAMTQAITQADLPAAILAFVRSDAFLYRNTTP